MATGALGYVVLGGVGAAGAALLAKAYAAWLDRASGRARLATNPNLPVPKPGCTIVAHFAVDVGGDRYPAGTEFPVIAESSLGGWRVWRPEGGEATVPFDVFWWDLRCPAGTRA